MCKSTIWRVDINLVLKFYLVRNDALLDLTMTKLHTCISFGKVALNMRVCR